MNIDELNKLLTTLDNQVKDAGGDKLQADTDVFDRGFVQGLLRAKAVVELHITMAGGKV